MNSKQKLIDAFAWVHGHSDLWRLFYDAEVFAIVVDELAKPFQGAGVNKVVAVESKGFILGSAVAYKLGAGFVAIRKPGSFFPGSKIEVETGKDYRGNRNVLRLQARSISAGDKVILVDDWFETGSQALAAKELLKKAGAEYLGASIIVDQLSSDVSSKIGNVHSVIIASELGDSAAK